MNGTGQGETALSTTPPARTTDSRRARPGQLLPPWTFAGLAVAVIAILAIAFFTYRALLLREAAVRRISQTMQTLQQLEMLLSSVQDAETGQRGFLITRDERYLEPYTNARAALPTELATLHSLVADEPEQGTRVSGIERLVADKLGELAETIALVRANKGEVALNLVRSDRGKGSMDRIRTLIGEMETSARASLDERQRDWEEALSLSTRMTWGGSALLIVLIVIAGVMMSRDHQARETEVWLRAGLAGLSLRVQGEQRLDQLGENALGFLAQYLGAQAGAVYLVDAHGALRRFAQYAGAATNGQEVVARGEGLIGQVAASNTVLHVTDVPDGYLSVASGLGRGKPTELLIGPGAIDRAVHAVVELGFFRRLGAAERELLSRISEPLGVAVRASKDRTRLEELLEETQRQAEELQVQQEELRVSNEELEEQSRVLKESQARLETQQTELEQINSQLEEQAQALEAQRDDLSNAQVTLNAKATELERANQYKSEFLANMSHELRTPLNSSLILAKLLADNAHGNLTDEQVSYAQTIFSAGNDLLALINDILDLSKIEAGKVELRVEPLSVAKLVADLDQTFQPMAQQKHLGFEAAVADGCPETIETDSQRLGQVLKNLLSNAVKFTETGTVTLRVSGGASNTIRFEVRDTGIGIPLTQQAVVFEAFRQADGSTHRKYGGTGLGLSISRDLAHLLGGNISLWSVPGEGSAFTLTLPVVAPMHFVAPAPVPTPAPQMHPPAPRPRVAAAPPPVAPAAPQAGLQDDRDLLVPDMRRILVIEDDTRFAAVLRDLAHEMGFQCILTHSANAGLAAATSYSPSAIVLDVNLPDHSGLGVLDQLKRNPHTRHIPVHVVSVADYTHQALELGAIGYALKPVQREDLVDAFRRLEAKAAQSMRRVLVVEDDERQRESIRHLLGAGDVQITAVGTASDALAQLSSTTFDCMVMDLKLPDFSGYELLEKMAAQEDVSFPPVIVYTGRSLSKDEEQRLGRFSRSIIIKDARSPERLLDEVTLFLHQVESALPPERQRMLKVARDRDTALEGRRVLVVEDDARNIFALSSVLEPKGAKVAIARNGREAVDVLSRSAGNRGEAIDLVLMDIMMPEMDGFTAMREIRKRPEFKKLPIIALTAKAMKDDQDKCLAAGANDYIAKPLDVEKLLSLVRVWMPNRT